jgi:hypothetical protein
LTRVLDERGAFDDTLAARDGVSARTVREARETARALESLPRVAAAAHAGRLSSEQLEHVAQLADEQSDAEWASRAPKVAPVDLARLARTQSKPTVDDSRRRREARSLRMWWQRDTGTLSIRGELPDLDGARFETTINQLVDRMRPGKGQSWDTRDHRGADALMSLCQQSARDDAAPLDEPQRDVTPIAAPRPLLVVQVPLRGPAEVAGIPLPDAMVEQLRANAPIEPVLVADHGEILAVGRRGTAVSPKILRAVQLRDSHCRVPGCERRTGLQVHHLVPVSWGGTDDIANLAAVCTGGHTDHHTKLVPHGSLAILGNPNRPDGLELVHLDHLTSQQATQLGLPPPQARAG